LQHLADGVEEPAVRIDLLLVLCLDNEDNLDRYQIVWIVSMWKDKLRRSIDRELRGVLQENKRQSTIYN
jgi:hypothetical protein